MIFRSHLYYRLLCNELDYKKWDMLTITPNDYTVVLKITRDLWLDYKSKEGEFSQDSDQEE